MNVSSRKTLTRELKPFEVAFLSSDDPRFLCLKYQVLRYFEDLLTKIKVIPRVYNKSHHQLQDALHIELKAQTPVDTHEWTSASVAKPTSSASCSWWWLCYMSKRICGQVLVLSSRRLERTAPGVYEKSEKVKMFIKSKTYDGHKNHCTNCHRTIT